MSVWRQIAAIRTECREATPPPADCPYPSVHLAFIARRILGAALTWRFAVAITALDTLVWAITR